ncbi:Protein DA1-like [Trema orientale]|uniref:Protein DA1-like n=1 Tax=Trema orientale TaxID=63057 RepID=A0A2P5DF56_TREOI|nr:Protein DA1-like [Trema orientale]
MRLAGDVAGTKKAVIDIVQLGFELNARKTINEQRSLRPKFGAGNRAMDMITEPYKLTRRCEVAAILILYGLPRNSIEEQ